MEKKSNGKVIFITALISVISALVLVVGIFFAVRIVSSVNSARTVSSVNSAKTVTSENNLDGYYENDSFWSRTNIEIKGNEAIIMWKGTEYVGELDPKNKKI